MDNKMPPIVSAQELKALIGKPNCIVIDASYPKGKISYEKEHIVGSLFVDLDKDLADIKSDFKWGGRHPLPSIKNFVKVLNALGISNNSHILIYDRNNGAFASRMWWMMRSIGHETVQVLDGGFDKAKEEGLQMEIGDSVLLPISNYQAQSWGWPLRGLDELSEALGSHTQKVIDVRGAVRYKGEVEPIDTVAGHIPGAVNAPFTENLNADGRFKSVKELQSQYQELLGEVKSKDAIFHCGSGVTACHSILALDIAGFEIPALYVGSWSEWSRNNKPMFTHE
jgi:thiosulfate/3-mercaptopyruvate sulfurtransferase